MARISVKLIVKTRALIFHNKYKISGGEDSVVCNESQLLENNKNLYGIHYVDNHSINGFYQKVKTLLQTPFIWSNKTLMNKVFSTLEKPDVVHVHNYFPLFSPSIFGELKNKEIPTVHTLHNYRSVCPTALLMFDGHIEERSVTGSCWWAVPKKVYRGSYIGTFVLCFMIELHKKLGTWQTNVDAYIALTKFSRNKFIEAGWPASKIHVKPNFIEDKFSGELSIEKKGGYAVFVGRLSEEKDIATLLKAWRNIDYPLKIIGMGPLEHLVTDSPNDNVESLGKLPTNEVISWIKNADVLVLPSVCYEGFPMVSVRSP